jgi:hypothetical protein
LALLVCAWAGGCGESQGGQEHLRRYEYRGIGGFSMGSMSAAILGLRHHERFDIIAPLGGSIDLGLFLHIIKDELMAGFCEPPEVGRMCPATPDTQTYERMNVGPPSQGGFRRTGMIEAFNDMAIGLGNPILFNPAHGYLPPGVEPEYLDRSRSDQCERPVRLEGFFDDKFNPDGLHPVITYCEGNGPERGVFDPSAPATKPVEITLAVDLNDNGIRDSGEPVLFQAAERFDDTGEDGLPSEQEPGYDPASNPDPAGDDWDRFDNPFGTEGNHVWEEGEPYQDTGLDGVAGTADSPYDWGEGNGRYDVNMNLMRSAVMYDPARLLKDLTPTDLARLDFYIDVGIHDHLRFLDTCESFAGILQAKGRPVDVRDTFHSLLVPDWDRSWEIGGIDWEHIGRDVLLRYGHWDATPGEIEAGDGGHVGTGNQALWRFFTIAAYVSEHWPAGDFRKISPCPGGQLLDRTYPSALLGEDRQYFVLLPPGYADDQQLRYPVLYMIHGIGMSATDLTASALFTPDWMCQGKLQKFITVFPDGQCEDECFDGNFFLDQVGRNRPPRAFESSFFQELIPHIDATYRTRPPEEREVPAAYLLPLGGP